MAEQGPGRWARRYICTDPLTIIPEYFWLTQIYSSDALFCQPHRTWHGQHLNLKMDMDGCRKWNIQGKLSQCHGCWCPGDLRHQVISNHGIENRGSINWTLFSTTKDLDYQHRFSVEIWWQIQINFYVSQNEFSMTRVNSLWPSDAIWVNIGSGNGLLPDGTKPLPEPMLTDHQWSPVTSILGRFHKRHLNHQSLSKLHV